MIELRTLNAMALSIGLMIVAAKIWRTDPRNISNLRRILLNQNPVTPPDAIALALELAVVLIAEHVWIEPCEQVKEGLFQRAIAAYPTASPQEWEVFRNFFERAAIPHCINQEVIV